MTRAAAWRGPLRAATLRFWKASTTSWVSPVVLGCRRSRPAHLGGAYQKATNTKAPHVRQSRFRYATVIDLPDPNETIATGPRRAACVPEGPQQPGSVTRAIARGIPSPSADWPASDRHDAGGRLSQARVKPRPSGAAGNVPCSHAPAPRPRTATTAPWVVT